jgi:protein gp37
MPPTNIPYAHYSFSPWQGCEKVSSGCRHCFAEAVDERFYGGGAWGPNKPRRMQREAYWQEPIEWHRRAKKRGVRKQVLCGTMCDVLMPSPYENVARARKRLWNLIEETPFLDWMILTKRAPQIMLIPPSIRTAENVWLGVTVEDQQRAEERLPVMLSFEATIRWVSAEPLLEPLDLRPWLPEIDWLVAGAESGRGRRNMLLDWARDLRDQCRDAETAFFFKQAYDKGSDKKVERPELDGQKHVEMP